MEGGITDFGEQDTIIPPPHLLLLLLRIFLGNGKVTGPAVPLPESQHSSLSLAEDVEDNDSSGYISSPPSISSFSSLGLWLPGDDDGDKNSLSCSELQDCSTLDKFFTASTLHLTEQ